MVFSLKLVSHWSMHQGIERAPAFCCRLRKAIKHNVQDARAVEHDYARSLNQQMVAKISTTAGLKKELERQLAKLREEQAKVLAQRGNLMQAIDAKR